MKEIKFKGFCPNEQGTTTIYLDGKEIKGDWVVGFYCEFPNKKGGIDDISCQIFVPQKEFSGLVKHKVCDFWLTNVLVYNGDKSLATNDLDLGSFDEAECEIKVIGNIFENKDLLEER